MTAAVYGRKSKYSERGASVENQIEACKIYAQNRLAQSEKVEFIIYKDDGFSGKNTDRPQFKQMLYDAAMQRFDILICYRLDRISRSVSDFSSLVETLEKHRVSFVCIKEQFDTTTPMGRAMMYIASVFAQLERETIAQRVTDNMLMLAQKGIWLGGTTPYGYSSCKSRTVLFDGKVKTCCNLKLEQTQAQVVRRVFDAYLACNTLQQASDRLNTNGCLTAQNRPFTLHSVRNIITNPVYCAADKTARKYFLQAGSMVSFAENDCTEKWGLLPYNRRSYGKQSKSRNDKSKWILAMGCHKPLISGETWVFTQKKLTRR